ncbi:SDR family oxidoreductase [Salipiger mucosus]|uniref:Putative short-chain dehydrogenase/oxidoreductase n=1 Tax=Salipiger mucosus DSM 16094 TaxID=1123237 RepID=S9SD23_9RHOB|nr:SDR family oxidoreductase [Salipiger mucosus]EPX84109.1 putative short-chain dehydrogenase/oxidoreductase [Salipiger mucosus DSM 16094]
MNCMTDRVVAITGASSGIGRATAMTLAGHGASLALAARGAENLRSVAEEIKAAGGRVVTLPTDVSDRASVQAFVDSACAAFGRIDALINNAGIGPISPLDALQVEDWDLMVDINLMGALNVLAAVLPVLRRQDGGHLVNVVSVAGLQGVSPRMAVYAATKNAVRTVGEGLRAEAGPNLRVTNVSPGFVKTNFAGSMSDPEVRAAIEARMEEIGLSPEAVANAILFAVSQPDSVEIGDITIRPSAQG